MGVRVLEDWLLTPERAAVHEPTRTAIVADLHLGYGAARQQAGDAIPVPDLALQLAPLHSLVRNTSVRRLVVAGDLFEDAPASGLVDDLLGYLRRINLQLAAVVTGNHDRGLESLDGRLPMEPDGFHIGGWRVMHGHEEHIQPPVIHGHHHPCVRWRGRRRPCFLVGAGRLVLPAFSMDAAGVSVDHDRQWQGFHAWIIDDKRIVPLPI
jgi:uncharacterized protein